MGEIHLILPCIGHPGGFVSRACGGSGGGAEGREAHLWRKGRCGRTRSRGIRGSPRSGGRPRCPRRPAASVPGAAPPAPLPYASTPSASSRRRTSGAPSLSPEPEISGRSPRRHSPDGERKGHPSNPTSCPFGSASRATPGAVFRRFALSGAPASASTAICAVWSRKRMEELKKAASLSSSDGACRFFPKHPSSAAEAPRCGPPERSRRGVGH